jgi:hypothetical protein
MFYDLTRTLLVFFFWPFYPATAISFFYFAYVLKKKIPMKNFMIWVYLILGALPSLVAVVYTILDVAQFNQAYGAAYTMLYMGGGMIINLISCVLLMLYFLKHRRKPG